METSSPYKDFIKKHSTIPQKNCHSCEHCSDRPAYGGEHLGWECAKGWDEKDPNMFFDGTDWEVIDCPDYMFDGHMIEPSKEEIFNLLTNKRE